MALLPGEKAYTVETVFHCRDVYGAHDGGLRYGFGFKIDKDEYPEGLEKHYIGEMLDKMQDWLKIDKKELAGKIFDLGRVKNERV